MARSCVFVPFLPGVSLAPANAGEGGTVQKVGDGFDLGQVGGGVLDEGELVNAFDVERLSILELAMQEHLFKEGEESRQFVSQQPSLRDRKHVRGPMPFLETRLRHTR